MTDTTKSGELDCGGELYCGAPLGSFYHPSACDCSCHKNSRAPSLPPKEAKGSYRERAEALYRLYTPKGYDHPEGITPILNVLQGLAQEKDKDIERLEHANNYQADLLTEFSAKIDRLESELNGFRSARDA